MVLIFGRCITDKNFRDAVLRARRIEDFPDVYGYSLDPKIEGDLEIFEIWYKAVHLHGFRALSQSLINIHDEVCPPTCPCDDCPPDDMLKVDGDQVAPST